VTYPLTLSQIIKFTHTGAQSETIAPVDHGILELKKAVLNLHDQVTNIQGRIDRYIAGFVVDRSTDAVLVHKRRSRRIYGRVTRTWRSVTSGRANSSRTF
jgi:hypothetical protein